MTRLLHRATPIVLLLTLPACGAFRDSPDPDLIDVDPPEAAITEPCEPVRWLPDRALTQAEVEINWRSDRRNLIDCAERHAALVDYALSLIGEVSGE